MSYLFGILVKFRFQEAAKDPQQRASTAYFGAGRYFSGETISVCSQGRRYFTHIPELKPSSQIPTASSGEPQFLFHMVHFSSIPENVIQLFNIF